jgi:branched-chain amino acid transport system ATP-binding protein
VTEPALQVHALTKRFGGLVAVDNVALSVSPGEILGLVGPNGAGKTTLLNCVAGLLQSDSGSIKLGDRELAGLPAEARCRLGLSRTFQIPRPFPKLTALENVMVSARFGRRGGEGSPESVARKWLEFVEFRPALSTRAEALNSVDLKRLDLARALGSEPTVLLLDEIAAGLMSGELGGLMDVIKRIRGVGVAVILVEHLMRSIRTLSDRVVVLHYGEKMLEGLPGSVMSDPQFIEIYLGTSATSALA